ncbi:acetylornithine aminotransferase [Paenibacillus baekrokdamisoli]|uniref:Acetylornithine aminotransferase n=1 Tax=Paenibacillus baekrokdamisoli TaxID=1712516 RepID=A0A3G9ILK0_9BACL|nr:acetylornithine/succinylornithine family transaminase [Paenibacillus baekrokdamisoli]MBB3067598.1 acetylornithine/N-succinyldiaminopimelate aminotransferase [Paenibacillus baekrokdamisoli]BBH19216.1 acetylornithine aminotransferase [Paenibacillus baekrokdamisoli]
MIQSSNRQLEEAKDSILFTAARSDIVMERGEGMYLWDTEGKLYLDFIGGWAVTCLGHSPAVIREALERQASVLVNASPAFYNKPMLELAKLLTDLSCFDKVFFASSGAEANESAIKLARKHGLKNLGGAYEIITMTNGFHGRSLATMSATGKSQWEPLFAPKVPGFRHVSLNDIDSLMSVMNRNTCAVMLELVQGEGGIRPVDVEYLYKLRKVCDEYGVMLIYDEIQTGLGRTGKLFAYELYGIEADVMTLGKGIGGGFPLSAMLTKEAFNLFDPGDQGGTYSGQPLAMAVGLAVVNEVVNRNLPAHAGVQGDYILERLHGIKETYQFTSIRGQGLLIAFDLPDPKGAELVSECLKEGLLINSPSPHTIRLMPALIVSRDEIDAMFDKLCRVMDRVLAI